MNNFCCILLYDSVFLYYELKSVDREFFVECLLVFVDYDKELFFFFFSLLCEICNKRECEKKNCYV